MNTELIGQTWDKLVQQEQVIHLLLERFFQQFPDYKPLFSETSERKLKKMFDMLGMVARLANDTEILHPQLVKIGERHTQFKLGQQDLENFRGVFLQVLGEVCGDHWNETCQKAWLEVFEERIIPYMMEGINKGAESRQHVINTFHTRTSVRNQLVGTVVSIKPRMYHGEVLLELKGGSKVLSILTLESISRLGLREGSEAFILIRAPHLIMVREDSKLQFSAANRLCGKVVAFNHARLISEITLALQGGDLLKAAIPHEAVIELNLKEGEKLCGIFKATNVILAVEG